MAREESIEKIVLEAKNGNVVFFESWISEKDKRQHYSELLRTPGQQGWSALHVACMFHRYRLVQKLFRSFAVSVNCPAGERAQEWQNATLLHCASVGKWIDKKNWDGDTVYEVAPVYKESGDERLSLLKFLLYESNDGGPIETIHLPTVSGATPLHVAAKTNCWRAVQMFLEWLDGSQVQDTGRGMLTEATPSGRKKRSKKSKKAWPSQDGDPMEEEEITADEQIVEVKTDFVPKRKPRRFEGDSSRSKEVLNSSDHYGLTPLHMAAKEGHVRTFKMLLQVGDVNFDAKSSTFRTALHFASEKGHIEIVKMLLETVKVEDINGMDSMSMTALHLAAMEGHPKVVEELLKQTSIQLNLQDQGKLTPLQRAAHQGQADVIKLFLECHGVDINYIPDKSDKTALHLAAEKGHLSVVRLLINHPDVNVLAGELSPALLAVKEGHHEIVKLFLSPFECKTHPIPNRTCVLCKRQEDNLKQFHQKCTRVQETSKGDNKVDEEVSMVEAMMSKGMGEAAEMLLDRSVRVVQGTDDFKIDYRFLTGCQVQEPDKTKPGASRRRVIKPSEEPLFNSTLRVIAKKENTRLLTHPVVLSLVRRKWRLVRRFIVMYCMIEAFLASLLTVHLNFSSTPRLICANTTSTICNYLENNSCTDICSRLNSDLTSNAAAFQPDDGTKRTLDGTSVAVTILAGTLFVKEMVEMILKIRRKQWIRYFFDGENLLQLFAYTTAIAVVWPWHGCGYVKCDEQWQLAAFSVLAVWLSLLMLLRKFIAGGIFIVMFTEVLSTYLGYLSFFVLFIIAFSVPFFMLYKNEIPFQTLGNSLLKTSTMATGEIDLDPIVFNKEGQVFFTGSYILMALFLFVMVLIMQNLLTGIAFEDVKRIHDEASFTKLSRIVELCLDWEKVLKPIYMRMTPRRSSQVEGANNSKPSHLMHALKSAIDPEEGYENAEEEEPILLWSITKRFGVFLWEMFCYRLDTHGCTSKVRTRSINYANAGPANKKRIESLRNSLCQFLGISGENENESKDAAAIRAMEEKYNKRMDKMEDAIKALSSGISVLLDRTNDKDWIAKPNSTAEIPKTDQTPVATS